MRAVRPPSTTCRPGRGAAFAALPADFRKLTDVIFRVDDFAADEVLDELGIENPFDLSGLYSGVHIGHRSVLDPRRGRAGSSFLIAARSWTMGSSGVT